MTDSQNNAVAKMTYNDRVTLGGVGRGRGGASVSGYLLRRLISQRRVMTKDVGDDSCNVAWSMQYTLIFL